MVTMRDVASRAGVSKATVSHVLNGTRFVEPGTAARVRQAISDMGYRPNLLARSLRRQETRTLGLLIPNIANPFWADLAHAVERTGYAEGYSVILGNSNWSATQEHELVQKLLAQQIDGIILSSLYLDPATIDEILAAVPVVLMDDPIMVQRRASAVLIDNYRGGILAGEYLAQLGHRRIGCVDAPLDAGRARDRAAGLRAALAGAGIDLPNSAIFSGDFEHGSGEVGVQILLERHPDLTAIFAANDHMAIGVIKGLRRAGRRIPDDVSVIGFDNISFGTIMSPELTTIAQPITEIGRKVIQLLIRHIQQPGIPPDVVVLEPTLIVRESSRAIGS
jgi:LacI family transcriptional regulator